jgi:hypothetical protein
MSATLQEEPKQVFGRPTTEAVEVARKARLVVDKMGTDQRGLAWRSYAEGAISLAYSSNGEMVKVFVKLGRWVEVFRSDSFDSSIRVFRPGRWQGALTALALSAAQMPDHPSSVYQHKASDAFDPIDDSAAFREVA